MRLRRTIGSALTTTLVATTFALAGAAVADARTGPSAAPPAAAKGLLDALAVVTPALITGPGAVGSPLDLAMPTWNLPLTMVDTSVQWFSNGAPIPGATGASYVPVLSDAGTEVMARVTGTVLGRLPLDAIDSFSNTILVIPLTSAPAIAPAGGVTVTGTKKIGTTLALQGPTWNPADAATTYQWLRDGAPIAGATLATYQLTAPDLDHAIAVKVTGHKEGWTDATVTSGTVTPLVGDPISFVTRPTASGTGKVGSLLTAAPGTWSGGTDGGAQPAFAYQWQRNGVAIPGAVGQQYLVRPVDAGKDLSVAVTATRPAYEPGSSSTADIHVARLASVLSARLAQSTIRKGGAAVMKLALKVPGVVKPAGAITIMEGTKVLKTIRLTAGTASVKLRNLKPGLHELRAVCAGNAAVAGSRSKVLRLTVKK